MINRVLLFDGDIIAYQAAAAVEKVICWEEDLCVPIASMQEAKAIFDERVAFFMEELEASSYIVALSDSANFRKDILPTYKSNRDGKAKPVALRFLKEAIMETHPTFLRPGLEADDVLGILSTSKKIVKADERIILSGDKDMRSIPGLFYHFDERDIETITEVEANRWWMMQTLMGDTADGYSGCPGIGPKKAEAILEGLTELAALWEAVVATYKKAKLSEHEALTQARVARILRVTDYDFKKKEPKLWKP